MTALELIAGAGVSIALVVAGYFILDWFFEDVE